MHPSPNGHQKSTPAASSRDFTQRAIELDVILLCGLMDDTSNLVSPDLNSFVLSSYSLNAATGHNWRSSVKDGKKNSAVGFPCLDCFAWDEGYALWFIPSARGV